MFSLGHPISCTKVTSEPYGISETSKMTTLLKNELDDVNASQFNERANLFMQATAGCLLNLLAYRR